MLKDIQIELQSIFGSERIIAILTYNSDSLLTSMPNPEDLGICIVLDSFDPLDLERFRKFLNASACKFSFNIDYLEDIGNKQITLFSRYSSLLNLINSNIIYGDNVFLKKYLSSSKEDLKVLLCHKIYDYYRKIDELLIKYNYEFEIFENFRKYILEILIGFLLIKGDISFEEIRASYEIDIISLTLEKTYFSKGTKCRIMDVFYNNVSSPILFNELKRFLFSDYLEIISNDELEN